MTPRSCVGALVGSVLLVVGALAGCSSSAGHALRAEPSTTAGPTPNRAPLAQFTPAEALELPAPIGADAAALAALARGAPPTIAEVVAAEHGMDGEAVSPPAARNMPASARAELRAAASAARRYPTAAAAQRAGYRLASRFLPGIGAHWIKWSLVTAPFDAAQPSMLLYDGNGPSARLVGLSYYTESPTMPTGFRAGGAQWHRHIGLCIVHGVLIGEGIVAPSACAHGLLLPGRNIWMLHVWVVPGMANTDGVFAPVNPALCTAAAPCSVPPK